MEKSVSVRFQDNQYVVRVVDGEHAGRREFAVQQFAMAWANGQRIRLNLPEIIIESRAAAE